MLFERLARSRDRDQVLALAREGHEVQSPADLVKDPYVLELVGLPEATDWLESDLEQALIHRLQQFLLELGRDLFFVARQKRITSDGPRSGGRGKTLPSGWSCAPTRTRPWCVTRWAAAPAPVFAARYQLHLPTEQELADKLERDRFLFEQQRRDQRKEPR